jgi:hypothetical protein
MRVTDMGRSNGWQEKLLETANNNTYYIILYNILLYIYIYSNVHKGTRR